MPEEDRKKPALAISVRSVDNSPSRQYEIVTADGDRFRGDALNEVITGAHRALQADYPDFVVSLVWVF